MTRRGEVILPLLRALGSEINRAGVGRFCDHHRAGLRGAGSGAAHARAGAWSAREEEFVERAGDTLMAQLAVHDKRAADERFIGYRQQIERGADDDRNVMKKAVTRALRQIGKRNATLHAPAVATAAALKARLSRTAHGIGADALRELMSEAVLVRLAW